ANYIKNKYHVVDSLTDENGKPVGYKDGKPPYDRFYADVLTAHHGRTREAYLYQKIHEPRSYDYNRLLPWDERSRMPQFQFARTHKQPKETKDAYQARSWKEESDAREAVMTFVLGLIAEPIPLTYLNTPGPDRMAEVKGRQILDKYNCAGCHM